MQSLDDVVDQLSDRRLHAGTPSFSDIAQAVCRLRLAQGLSEYEAKVPRSTVYAALQKGRRRLDASLVREIALALGASDDTAHHLSLAVGRVQRGDHAAQVANAGDQLPTFSRLLGREDDLASLTSARPGEVVAISGLGGMGKSHLAVAAARGLIESGTVDGVVYVDLRGNDAELPPIAPAAVQQALLRVLGHANPPREHGRRRDLLASAMSDHRAVIVLDDAVDSEQVAAALPTSCGECIVLVTARSRILLDSVRQLVLDPLPELTAFDLLATAVDASELLADPVSAHALIEATGGIPLAIELLTARIRLKPDWSLSDHVHQLLRRREQLSLESPLALAIESSYSRLDAEDRSALRLLAAEPLTDLCATTLDALWATSPEDAAARLDRLVTANLVQRRIGRVSLHDQVRALVLDIGLAEDPNSARIAAVDRLAARLVSDAWAAHVGMHAPGEGCLQGSHEAASGTMPAEVARQWFSDECDNLLTLSATLEQRRPDVVVALSGAVSPWLNNQGRHQDSIWLHTRAVALAGDDEVALARARVLLGHALARTGATDSARHQIETGLVTLRRIDDLDGQQAALFALALTDYQAGRYEAAATAFEELAMVAHRKLSPYEEATALGNASDCLRAAGKLDEAAVRVHEALDIARREGYGLVVAANQINLSEIIAAMGQFERALAAAEEALPAAEAQAEFLVGFALLARAGALVGLNRHSEARSDLNRASHIAQAVGDQDLLARATALLAT